MYGIADKDNKVEHEQWPEYINFNGLKHSTDDA